jgi:hypothetical protein
MAVAALLLGLAVAVAGAGCGGNLESKAVKVSGVITLDDKPLPLATMTFIPLSGNGPTASGTSDEAGKFTLVMIDTARQQSVQGAMPGEYKVVVDVDPPGSEGPAKTPEEMAKDYHKQRYAQFKKSNPAGQSGGGGSSQMRQQAKPKSPIPIEYANADRTPLKVTIPAGGGDIQVKLKKSGG